MTHAPQKSKGGLARITKAARYSWQGLRAAFLHEAAFRQELVLAAVLIPLAVVLSHSAIEFILLIAPIVAVLVVELLNSSVEALADAISIDQHPLLGRAKDIGSAAVFICLVFTAIVWACILIPRFFF